MLFPLALISVIFDVAVASNHGNNLRRAARHGHYDRFSNGRSSTSLAISATTTTSISISSSTGSSSLNTSNSLSTETAGTSLVQANASSTSNGIILQGFEWYLQKDEQHWNRLNGQLAKLSGIGIDKIWIPPATKAGANPSTGYDVYDLWDLGEFDQKGHVATSYGTKDELVALSENATSFGIKLLADGVLNQRSGADAATPCQAHKISAWVSFDFPGRSSKYSNKTWTCDDFSAVDYDNDSKENAIFKLEGSDNNFATDVSTENGNYDYLVLADVAYANPSVQEDVKAWGTWVVEELGLGGFRLDAAKHISKAFLLNWVSNTKAQSGNSDLIFIAEYLTGDTAVISAFVSGFEVAISVFDTPLQTKFHEYSTGDKTDLTTVLSDTWLSTNPDQAVTYVMNHDTQEGQALSSLIVEGWFMPLAYALILLRQEGYPTIFYGDLYGEYDAAGNFTAPPYASQIADLATARKYFAYGTQTDYFNNATEVGWTRQGDNEHPEGLAVVLSNAQGGTSSLSMNVGTQHAGEVWSSLFGGEGKVTIGADGFADFVTGAGTINMYTLANATERANFGSWDISI